MASFPLRGRRRRYHNRFRRAPISVPARGPLRIAGRLTALVALFIALVLAMVGLAVTPVSNLATSAARPFVDYDLPKAPAPEQTTFVYDRRGRLIGTLHAGINRTVIGDEEIPQVVKDAVVAVEDKDFYRHTGFSIPAIARAALADLSEGRLEQGGSTISQQYVKNVYTEGERTLSRKIREAVLAVKLEQEYSKEEILTQYLNTVYFGRGAYGIQAAAETYFGRPASELNLVQAATLAGLIPAPSRYDPLVHPEAGMARRNFVLGAMAEQGYLSSTELAELQAKPLKFPKPEKQDSQVSYFVDHVSRELVKDYGYDKTFTGGLQVATTLDLRYQRAAERAVERYLPDPKGPAAALVAIDPSDGGIRAMVGGRNFNRKKFNLALQAHRQTGSAFKAFTLAAAVERGISLKSVWTGASSMVIDDPRCRGPNREPWKVSTYEGGSFGQVDLVRATQYSVNTAYAEIALAVGPDRIAEMAKRLGVRSKLEPVCSITLGSQAVTPMDMTAGFATLAARGVRHRAAPIQQVTTPDGEVLAELNSKGKRVLAQNDADVVTSVLQNVVTSGTGTRAQIGRPTAGKTGTAQSHVDVWFCGYVPQLAACVWIGWPKAELPLYNIGGFSRLFGGSLPAMIWHDFMASALKNTDIKGFVTPDTSGLTYYPEGSRPPPPPPPVVEEPKKDQKKDDGGGGGSKGKGGKGKGKGD
jgi:penicillin-binding protein 1A